jgi:hypothetical protein
MGSCYAFDYRLRIVVGLCDKEARALSDGDAPGSRLEGVDERDGAAQQL